MPKVLTFITTHIINYSVISEYKKLKKAGYDCILAIDNQAMKLKVDSRIKKMLFFGIEVDCFFFDEELNDELKLPKFFYYKTDALFNEVMWYGTEYRFYYVKKYFPDYDYYWQFDYDIFCNGASYGPFLDKYKNFSDDLLICNLRQEPIRGDWCWTYDVEWAYPQEVVYASFFPICRLSNRAIDFLQMRRLVRKQQYLELKEREGRRWIYCELFVPTELILANFPCRSIEEKFVYYKIWDKEFDLNDRLFENPDNQLYHPVKGNFVQRLQKLKDENKMLYEQLQDLRQQLEKEQKKWFKLNLFNKK